MAVNINISLKIEAFSIIEKYCKENMLSKSQFLIETALEKIKSEELKNE